MLTCKEASQLVSQRCDRVLSWRERVGLRIHLWICNNCRNFARQLSYIRQALRTGQQQGKLPADKSLPPESLERIRKALHDHESH